MVSQAGAVLLSAGVVTVGSGGPFPDRDTIVFVTAGVVVTTLVMQALVLSSVARWAQLPRDTDAERELALAWTTASEAALDALPMVAAGLGTDPEATERLRAEYETRLNTLRAAETAGAPEAGVLVRHNKQDTALRLALLEHHRPARPAPHRRHRSPAGASPTGRGRDPPGPGDGSGVRGTPRRDAALTQPCDSRNEWDKSQWSQTASSTVGGNPASVACHANVRRSATGSVSGGAPVADSPPDDGPRTAARLIRPRGGGRAQQGVRVSSWAARSGWVAVRWGRVAVRGPMRSAGSSRARATWSSLSGRRAAVGRSLSVVIRLARRGAGAARAAEEWPAHFVAFDLLRLSGTETTGWPYRRRRAALKSVFAARRLSAPWALCPSTTEADVVRE